MPRKPMSGGGGKKPPGTVKKYRKQLPVSKKGRNPKPQSKKRKGY
jgi:hypothetical protein